MAKSQATFSKKENEKKRIKKRQDKEEKREQRKANAKKGKSLEEMFAYVDENGNLSSTPPDPMKKRAVNSEDIQIGYKHADVVHEVVRNGTVIFFNEQKGFAFIKDQLSGESVFVHMNALSGPIKENDKVSFEVEQGHKGLSAVKVKKI